MKGRFVAFLCLICAFLTTSIGLIFADSLGDPFDGTSLQNANWKWQNEPAQWDVGETTPGWLHITPANNQNLWDVDTVAKLYQEVSADEFDIETHLVMDYQGTDSLVSGLVAKGPNEGNWVTLKFWGRGGDTILQWQHKQQEVVNNVPGSSQPAGRVEVFIRIAKDGDEYTGYWKMNEGDDWTEITPHASISLTPPLEVGIYAGICTAGGTATMEYEYFNDLINPFEAAVALKGKLATCWGDVKSE